MRKILTGAALALGLGACGLATPDRTAEARSAVLAEAGADARILSLEAAEDGDRACGWVQAGGAVEPFVATRWKDDEPLRADILAIPAGAPAERAEALYYRSLGKQMCDALLSPPPQGAVITAAERQVDRLWTADRPGWAVVDISGKGDILGLQRRASGGVVITPAFKSPAALEAWLEGEGDALAAREQALGRAAMARSDACYDKARAAKAEPRCSDTAFDQTVVLKAAAAPAA